MAPSSFPFDAIVVTSPDPDAAPLSSLRAVLPDHVSLYSTSDPFGARCGSGGGTLAALQSCKNENDQSTILIVHAGGESSRCPTQMATGKAWTSLPLEHDDIANPTVLLVQLLAQVFADICPSSIVVAASDCLFHLPIDKVRYDENSVMGVAVPAPLSTARNHGVYCIDETTGKVTKFLQKPTVECMMDTPNCVFQTNQAFVDTGVVVFLPKAAAVLRNLSQTIDRCTHEGLRRLHRQSSSSVSLEDFSQHCALQIDLYTHILLALSTDSYAEYKEKCAPLPDSTLQEVYNAFTPFTLSALTSSNGSFRHLGTSRELVEFLCGQDDLARQLGLVKRAQSFCNCSDAQDSVLMNAVLESSTESCTIGGDSVLEHVHVAATERIEIGKQCLLSGVRGECTSLRVPDRMCFQMLPVKDSDAYIYMYVGLDDNVKKAEAFWGLPVETLLHSGVLEPRDIWNDDQQERTLWKARLHPIVEEMTGTCAHDKLFSWIAALQQDRPLSPDESASLAFWKSQPRLSLSEIRLQADAVREFQYRQDLEANIVPECMLQYLTTIETCLVQRLHTECSMESYIASYEATQYWGDVRQVIAMLKGAALGAFEKTHYDVSGRAFMLLSELLHRLAAVSRGKTMLLNGSYAEVDRLQQTMAKGPATIEDMTRMLQLCDSTLQSESNWNSFALEAFALVFEKLALTMIKLCVASPMLENNFCRIEPAPRDTWVIATAPARVDLSGAWSDTPPVCVEHGGAVCGIAVTVDGLKPLSCRCRLVTGGSGVLVRGEARDGRTGVLLEEMSAVISKVGDLNGYNDPKADCSLIKCALVYLGLTTADAVEEKAGNDISPYLQRFCGADGNVGLEIVSTSLLPHGSGMGTSSILGGCILASIAKCIGIERSDHDLVHDVSMLEQILSTGGGWQDQVGGLLGGAKLGTSANSLPLKTKVEHIPLSPQMEEELNRRLALVFTGQTRLAKNILQNVLKRWARRSKDIVETVEELTATAHKARDCLTNGDMNGLADCLNAFWKQKKIMTGESGEPPIVRAVLEELLARDIILAGSLCGAGGGGFMVVLVQEGRSSDDIKKVCNQFGDEVTSFTWHDCRLSREGLSTVQSAEDDFDMSWHKV